MILKIEEPALHVSSFNLLVKSRSKFFRISLSHLKKNLWQHLRGHDNWYIDLANWQMGWQRCIFPVNIYLLKGSNRNTRKNYKWYSKLRHQNHIIASVLLTLNKIRIFSIVSIVKIWTSKCLLGCRTTVGLQAILLSH